MRRSRSPLGVLLLSSLLGAGCFNFTELGQAYRPGDAAMGDDAWTPADAPADGPTDAPADGPTDAPADGLVDALPADLDAAPTGDDGPPPAVFWKLQLGNAGMLNAIWGSSKTDLYVVGAGGVIFHSSGDGHWTTQSAGTQDNFYGVGGNGPASVYAVTQSGKVFFSQGDGQWTQQMQTNTTLWSVFGDPRSKQAWAVGDLGEIFHSPGDGTWTAEMSGTANALFAVFGVDNQIYATGTDVVLQSAGNGTWIGDLIPPTSAQLTAIWGTTGKLWVGGGQGTILHYDSASGWAAEISNTGDTILGLWGSGPTDIYALLVTGKVAHSDGQGNWIQVNVGATPRGIWGSGPRDIYIVGDAGILHGS